MWGRMKVIRFRLRVKKRSGKKYIWLKKALLISGSGRSNVVGDSGEFLLALQGSQGTRQNLFRLREPLKLLSASQVAVMVIRKRRFDQQKQSCASKMSKWFQNIQGLISEFLQEQSLGNPRINLNTFRWD